MRSRSFLFFLFIPALIHAQDRVQVHGLVRDASSRKPVYCSVELQDPEGGLLALTHVNDQGSYALFLPVGTPLLLVVKEENGYRDLVRPIGPLATSATTFVVDLDLHPRDDQDAPGR